ECQALHALGQLLLIRARMRSEDHPTARVVRRAPRALPSAAGALLAVRLGTAAGHLAASLGVRRAGPATGQLGHDRLVHDGLVDRGREQRLRQVHGAGLGAGLGVERRGGHDQAFLTSTSALRAPGTGPLTSNRFFSGSARTTVTFLTVMRSLPMWPA